MAVQYGRTVKRWTRFLIKDSGAVLREIPVSSINGVGLDHPEVDMTAFQDAIKTALMDTPDCTIDITGPFDNSAAVAAAGSGAAPTLSGSHTVLNGINGVGTPLSLGIYFGIRHLWETGEPVFGLSSSATNGFLCFSYIVNPDDGTYSAKFKVAPGSAAPAWGTAVVA